MNFSTDRDLLLYEPTLFHDLPWAGQARLRVSDASVSGTTLTSPSADFSAAGVGAGNVVLLDDVAHEVTARSSATELTISLIRPRSTDAPIPPGDGTDQALVVRTFSPQARTVHDELLRLLGFEPGNPGRRVTEEAIVSLSLMAKLEALGTLERVFSSAIAVVGDNSGLSRKAAHYHERFRQAVRRATVLLDRDNDGVVDEQRTLSTTRLVRA